MTIDELLEELQKIKDRAGGWNMPVKVQAFGYPKKLPVQTFGYPKELPVYRVRVVNDTVRIELEEK